jgi:hypothetical protein
MLIIVLLISVSVLPLYHPTGIVIYLRLFLLFLILVESLKLFKIIFVDKTINKLITNLAIVLYSIFLLFILLEATFMFIPKSSHFDFTLACKLWFAKYWKPINSFGFRDNEPDNNNPVILFVGDSFTAGGGLKSIDDRFSNIVGKELNKKEKKYTVINIGKLGANSRDEYDSMINFLHLTGIKPEIIVLQYFGNDLENVLQKMGIDYGRATIPQDASKFLILTVQSSYLFNYIYWSLPHSNITIPYVSSLYYAYKNDYILSQHKAELMSFVDYARENSIELIVTVFPYFLDIEMSDSMYAVDISNFFRANKVSVINVSQLVKNIPVSERIINKNDFHASKLVNRIVAQEILRKL